MGKTIRLKIPICVGEDGIVSAYFFSENSEGQNRSECIEGWEGEVYRVVWAIVDVPVYSEAEVKGKVVS